MGLRVGSDCARACLLCSRSLCICCFLLRGIVVWLCAFLDLRLYALVVLLLFVCVGRWVCMFVLGESLFVVVVSLVCSAGAVDLCVVGGGGIIVMASGRSCCIFCRLGIF